MARQKLIPNAPLEVGDTVKCIKMVDDYPVSPGVEGKVKNISNVFGEKQYYVKWNDGSTLALIDGVDKWFKVVIENRDNDNVITKEQFIKESLGSENFPVTFTKMSKLYDISKIVKFFNLIKKSGITNMFQAGPYLYMGKERMKHEHTYTDMSDDAEEAFNEALDMADDVKNILIRGALKKHKNEDNADNEDNNGFLRKLENTISRDAKSLLSVFINLHGQQRK
jgi:hypothetical protein